MIQLLYSRKEEKFEVISVSNGMKKICKKGHEWHREEKRNEERNKEINILK